MMIKLVLIPFTFLIATLVPSAYAEERKVVLNTAIIPPYQIWNQHQKLDGTSVKIIKCIFNKMNRPLEIEVYSWKKAQHLVKEGRGNGFFIASENASRNSYAVISDKLIASSWIWYTLPKNTNKLKDKNFKSEGRVGVLTGTNMHSWVTKNYKNFLAAKKGERLFKLLKIGRIDAVLSTEPIFKSSVVTINATESEFVSKVQRKRDLAVYFSKKFVKKEPLFLSKFNSLISKCTN